MEYINPVMGIGAFGDVNNATLDIDATLDGAAPGGSSSSGLSLVPPPAGPMPQAGIPVWLIIAGLIAFLVVVASSERQR